MIKSHYDKLLRWINPNRGGRGSESSATHELTAITIFVLYEKILQSVHPYEPPPSGFDPMTATNEELEKLGLPVRPDAQTDPDLFHFWQLMLGGSTQFILPEFPRKADQLQHFALHRNGPGAQRDVATSAMRGFDHREDSRNWSGTYITPLRPNRFVHIIGGWTVPDPAVPRVLPSGTDRNNEEYRSSTWIGMDGKRPYPNASLPQIGTSQHMNVENGQQTTELGAWWQWWVKGRPEHHVPMPIVNFPVEVNDEMLASLTVQPSGDVLFHLKNQRSRLFVAFKVMAPTDIVPLGSTAEWIHERPTELNSTRMYPLPRCTEVNFRFCLARSSPSPGAPITTQQLDNARLIRMVEVFDNPRRAVLVSRPAKIGNSTTVVYREAGA
jgi:hypothetical protein